MISTQDVQYCTKTVNRQVTDVWHKITGSIQIVTYLTSYTDSLLLVSQVELLHAKKKKWRDINVQIMFSQSLRNKLWHIKLLWPLTFPWALNHYNNNKLLLYWTYWTYWQYKCITWMHCKSLWIKASAKCINVNVIIITNNVFLLLAAPGLQSGQIQLPLPARELLQWC